MRRLIFAIAALLCAAGPALAAAPLAAYGRLPAVSDLEISPDGRLIAAATTANGQYGIVVTDAADDKVVFAGALPAKTGRGSGDGKVRDIFWVDPTHLAVMVSRTLEPGAYFSNRYEFLSAAIVDIVARTVEPLLDDVSGVTNIVYAVPGARMIGGSPSLFLVGRAIKGANWEFVLLRYDVAAKRSVIVEHGGGDVRDWDVDADGQPIGRSLYHDTSGRWTLQVKDAAGAWKTVADEILPLGPPALRGLGRDGHSVITLSTDAAKSGDDDGGAGDGAAAEDRVLREYGAERSADLPGLVAVVRDPASHRMIGGVQRTGDEMAYTFFDPKDAAVWRGVMRAYPGQRVSLASWSNDRSKVVVRVDDPERTPAFVLVDVASRQSRWIAETYPALGEADVSPTKAYGFKAQDGLAIGGFLTLPRGKTGALPLIVLAHGGPASRDIPGFDWWRQALASRGYAVLQVNFRGSAGLGEALLKAGYGEWGRKMQTDLSDGVQALAGEGVIDPKRVCIVGASYGGYAALAGVTLQQGIYRCAVAVAGISDLSRLFPGSGYGGEGRSLQRYLNNFIGVTSRSDAKLDALSPLKRATRADAPILLIHGRDDTVVPFEHSRLMDAALTRAGKPHNLVALDGEDHNLSLADTRLKMLEATVAFLERENPPN